ncbi:Hypothetical protein CFV354_0588 [Campylobacter fetus subsp. venerealis NCTC 10354]|nr:Hypothetical protein CFV354_0588 [Campylobacter fetus subsp. venerealis NCTC 10354]
MGYPTCGALVFATLAEFYSALKVDKSKKGDKGER